MAGRPRTLPDNAVLVRDREILGLTIDQMATKYRVTEAAISLAFSRMNRPLAGGRVDYQAMLPWEIRTGHRALDAALRLRAHMRDRAGEDLTPAARRRVDAWRTRLDREHVVLAYNPDADSSPFSYVPRQDGESLVIRWPEGAAPPTRKQHNLLDLYISESGRVAL